MSEINIVKILNIIILKKGKEEMRYGRNYSC